MVEVIAKPVSLERWTEIAPRVQRDLFEVAASVGLKPPRYFSGGHMSFDLRRTFGEDALLFRNFLVDFANHSELASGIFKDDWVNAEPLTLRAERRARFEEVIRRFDQGEYRTIRELADAIHTLVNEGRAKSDALSLATLYDGTPEDQQRLEIRGLRAQQSAEHFVLQARLFLRRLEYLRRLDRPIPFLNREPVSGDREGVEAFHQYVTESGEDWEAHRRFLPHRYQRFQLDSTGRFIDRGQTRWERCMDKLRRLGGA